MTQWLIDTFVWTGALIALVLVLRRPVARHFGPQVAYAMWALPLLRFVLPPLVLPASMAPASGLTTASAAVSDIPVGEAVLLPAASLTSAAGQSASFDWPLLLAAGWLAGAMALLGWRFQQYRTMRASLLAKARPVGQVGAVRLVETPAVAAPVAFGVRDKVVALPLHFMAQHDRTARDLAIAHELAHHRGHDLLANILAQPLLALHWFNPLAWAGWRAMRRDQEAACDARVIAGCDRSERATYARVIAGFATGQQHLALAAPMACPVLGEKSIIQRLRSLTMADVSAARRKLGLGVIAGSALLALPLTASISYAQPDAPEAPEAPEPPTAPDAPAAPAAPHVRRHMVIVEIPEGAEVDDQALHAHEDAALADAEIEQAMAEARQAMAEARVAMDEQRQAMAEHNEAMVESRRVIARARADVPRIEANCDGEEMVRERVDADGRKVIVMCRRAVQASATSGLRQAQRAVRTAPGIPDGQRRQIIDDLQQQIDRLEREEVSFNVAPPAPLAPIPPVAPVVYPVAGVRVTVKAPPAPTPPVAPQPVEFAPVALWLKGGTLVFGTLIS